MSVNVNVHIVRGSRRPAVAVLDRAKCPGVWTLNVSDTDNNDVTIFATGTDLRAIAHQILDDTAEIAHLDPVPPLDDDDQPVYADDGRAQWTPGDELESA